MDIKFFYKGNTPNKAHEVIITSFTKAVSTVIELPDTIEVCLYDLGKSVYGGIDMVKVNRIGLNYDLSAEMLPAILVHELIHVHQKHVGTLKIKSNGVCYWYGVPYTNKMPEDMTREEYHNLPWELDVQNKQTKVFKQALAFLQQ